MIGNHSVQNSDTFGRSTGVRITVTERRSGLARIAALVACLWPIPAAPAVGFALRSFALSSMSRDATLTGQAPLRVAYWAGAVGTVIQLLVVLIAAGTVWLSVESARSVVLNHSITQGSTASSVKPEFALWEFKPGGTLPFAVDVAGTSSVVSVSFDPMPSWSGSAPVFASHVVPTPVQ